MLRLHVPVLFLMLPVAGWAQVIAKPAVQVVFEIREPTYRQRFADVQIPQIESTAASEVARSLGTRFEFLTFATTTQPWQLLVGLGNASGMGPRDVALHVDLAFEGESLLGEDEPFALPFRRDEQWLTSLGDAQGRALVAEIQTALTAALRSQADPLVDRVLGRIRLASVAHLSISAHDVGWILPFSKAELALDDDSRFVLRARIELPDQVLTPEQPLRASGETSATGSVPPEFRLKIRARLTDAEQAEELRRAVSAQALELRMARYRHLRPSSVGMTSPLEITAGADPP